MTHEPTETSGTHGLVRTFNTFFSRFPTLTEIQRAGIPAILAGRDVLLCAPTASGKTEAYAAPTAERLLSGPRAPFAVLVVSPTRALANDLHRRLDPRMRQLHIGFGRHTGEHKERRGGKPAEFAILTPESLDAALARHPDTLLGVRMVVLDEIHVLDGTPRGDQLRLLLERLDALTTTPPQRVAVSATVARPETFAARYLHDAVCVVAQTRRSIRAKGFEGRGPEAMASHLDRLAEAGFKKILVFWNSRQAVEEFVRACHGKTAYGGNVFAHHGSIAKSLRESVEKRFLETPAAVCAATLTLELGIDIGSVDYVLLAEPPPGVDHLLQRIGRGSRRKGELRAGYVHATAAEKTVFRVQFERAAEGDLCARPYAFRPSVIAQQALVLAGAERLVTAQRLRAILPSQVRDDLPHDVCARILEELVHREKLEHTGHGRYVLAPSTESLYERARIHGNIEAQTDVPVVDRLTGAILGHVSAENAERTHLRLSGRGFRLVGRERDRLVVESAGKGEAPVFAGRGAPPFSFALARAIARHHGLDDEECGQRRLNHDVLFLHCTGTAGARFLRWLIEEEHGMRVLETSPIHLLLPRGIDRVPSPVNDAAVDRFVARTGRELNRFLNMGPWHASLPKDLARASLRAAAGLDALTLFLRKARLRDESHAEAPPSWRW
ncbi:MAG: DEAD/DEAH box helicase [Planctomycetes bacterium]|nr:DEAD/DEAH box helicase [Planctomycetota bacterium]MCC7170903.1 DEAD/DEAH box helicase [Planctomycetota bacterium]